MNVNDDNAAQQLLDAIKAKDSAKVSLLISRGDTNVKDEPILLGDAARRGNRDIIAMLLDAGADMTVFVDRRNTACHIAIHYYQLDALKLFVERGANLGIVDSGGRSLLASAATMKGGSAMVEFLLDAGAPLDILKCSDVLQLVRRRSTFERLLARNVNNLTVLRDEIDATLCHYVAINVESEAELRFLLGVCGNDAIHEIDKFGATPLHWASNCGNATALRVLVELGADLDRQDGTGNTPLQRACGGDRRDVGSCAKLLLALGADVTVINDSGQTACHIATETHKLAVVCALVAAHYWNKPLPSDEIEIDAARRQLAKTRLDLVRYRAFEICVGLQPLALAALQLCEILMYSFGALGSLIAFHQWWAFAIAVKHGKTN